MHKNQFTQTLALVIFSFMVLMAIRLTLYGFYTEDFSNLTTGEFFASLFMGFRVDMITLFTFSSPFVVALFLLKWPKVRSKVALVWAIVLYIIFLLSFIDVIYYEHIHRHISSEIFNLSDDMDIIFGTAFGSMLSYTICAALINILFLYLVYRFFSTQLKSFISGKKLVVLTVVSLLVLFGGIRNSFTRKSFGISDAFAVNKVSSGNLALNGFFAIYRTAQRTIKHDLIDLDTAIKTTREALRTPNAPFIDEDYPFLRRYTRKGKETYNVVIVMLETFGAEHIDGFTRYKELSKRSPLFELSS